MRCLIVEDDFTARKLMLCFLSEHASCDVAADGREAVEAIAVSLQEGKPYDLICMDIEMPNMGGQEAIQRIRDLEREFGITYGVNSAKIIMTTAHKDKSNFITAFKSGCESYIIKPVTREKLVAEIEKLGMLPVR